MRDFVWNEQAAAKFSKLGCCLVFAARKTTIVAAIQRREVSPDEKRLRGAEVCVETIRLKNKILRARGDDIALVDRIGAKTTPVDVEGFALYRQEKIVETNSIRREFEEQAQAMRAAVPEVQSLSYELDSEGFKLVADQLVERVGVTPMLHRLFVALILLGRQDHRGYHRIQSRASGDPWQGRDRRNGGADTARRTGTPVKHSPQEELQAASVPCHVADFDTARFVEEVCADPQPHSDWSAREWTVETDGKEGEIFSPFLRKALETARKTRVIPADLTMIAGT